MKVTRHPPGLLVVVQPSKVALRQHLHGTRPHQSLQGRGDPLGTLRPQTLEDHARDRSGLQLLNAASNGGSSSRSLHVIQQERILAIERLSADDVELVMDQSRTGKARQELQERFLLLLYATRDSPL